VRVSGPVTGGTKGWAFGAAAMDLSQWGYRQDEFFLEGTAHRYGEVAGTRLGRDGLWQLEERGTSPYVTRIVVVRPEDPAAFNGTVVVLWNNVTAGYENFGGGESLEVFEGGYAYAAVSAQRVGVHGAGSHPQGLQTWDPERYGTLSIPSDDFSYDIFTQAAGAVAPDRPRGGVDPMGGLQVQRLIAQGASQSAARLATYLNGVQPLTGRFAAFFLVMYFGGGAPLEVGDAVMTLQADVPEADRPRIPEGVHLLRDDLGIPVMVVNTECEAGSCYGVRQPDTATFRYWEIAGASHVSLPAMASSVPRMERDFGFSLPLDDESMQAINRVSIAPVVDAALAHLQHWLCDGSPPPTQHPIEFAGSPPGIVRDADRIARGGVRLPQVDVPLAHNSAIQRTPDTFARLVGSYEAFSAEEVRRRYGSRDEYLARFEEAARGAVTAGVVPPRDVPPLLAEAAAALPI
jgi:Alpha/beta hydrolase domain